MRYAVLTSIFILSITSCVNETTQYGSNDEVVRLFEKCWSKNGKAGSSAFLSGLVIYDSIVDVGGEEKEAFGALYSMKCKPGFELEADNDGPQFSTMLIDPLGKIPSEYCPNKKSCKLSGMYYDHPPKPDLNTGVYIIEADATVVDQRKIYYQLIFSVTDFDHIKKLDIKPETFLNMNAPNRLKYLQNQMELN